MKVEFSPEADREADAGQEWWFAHRDKAPALFAKELERAVRKLSRTPFAGEVVDTPGLEFEVRYVAMRKTRFRVYYRVNREDRVVQVLRLWHMSRGDLPTF